MPPVVPKTVYERVMEAFNKCNFITMGGVQLWKLTKLGKAVTLAFKDVGGDEFYSTFDDTTSLTITGNSVLFVDKNGVEVTLKFFSQSKHYL